MAKPLDAVLAEVRRDAESLRRHGDARLAASLEALADAVEQAPEWELLQWLPESRAVVRSGHRQRFFRERRRAWEARGLARRTPKGWQYRLCALPDDRGEADACADDTLADRLLGRAS